MPKANVKREGSFILLTFCDNKLESSKVKAKLKFIKAKFFANGASACAALAVFICMAISGCASIQTVNSKSIESAEMTYEIKVTRQLFVPKSPSDVFKFIAAEDVLPKVLTGYGPLPAVIKTSGNTGPWDVVGSSRIVHLADQTTVREEITNYKNSEYFAYKIWDFGNPIVKTLATGGRGEWTFAAAEGGTQVTWTYTFVAKNGLTAIPMSAIAQTLWRGYMDVCLGNTLRLMTKA